MAPPLFIADPTHAVCDSLDSLLAKHSVTIHCFLTASEIIDHLPAVTPCCAVLDAGVTDLAGFEILRTIEALRPGLAIYVTYHDRYMPVKLAVLAMRFGARDVIFMPQGALRLVRLIRDHLT